MSTVSRRPTSKSRRGPDPFRYGWRYVRVIRPDGTEAFDQVPLTLKDVLHPRVGDIIVQSDPHDSDLVYLKTVFKFQLHDEPEAVVLSDCQVDFNIPGVKPLCPDISVFFGARRRILWSTFNVREEAARPLMVVEVTSPATRSNDVGIKMDYYHRAGVPWYVIADVTVEKRTERRIELSLYRRTQTGYQRVKPDKNGRVWLEPVGLWLGQTRDPQGGFMRLACYDPETGEEVGDYTAISQALAESQRLLEEESQARAQAEQARTQAEQARTQAEQARTQAEARAEAEAAQARAEADARAHAEARIRELEAQLKRSRRPRS